VVISKVAEEIGCQLIIMGTRGNSGLSHVLLGSVAERTLRIAPCSVLTVKAEDCQGGE
jgi:nucleotide-binding universal stress UspA family protein